MLNLLKKYSALMVFLFSAFLQVKAQSNVLDGKLSKIRTAFDVQKYKIRLRVDPSRKFISGENEIHFKAIQSLNKIQLDLDTNIKITKINSPSNPVEIDRQGRTILLSFQLSFWN